MSYVQFAMFTLLCTEVAIQRQRNPPLPLVITSFPFYRSHPRIRCATSLAIIQTRHPTSTTTLPPRPFRAPSYMAMATLRESLLSLPVVQICLLRLHPLTRQPPKVAAFLNPFTTRVIHGGSDPSSRTTHLSTPEPSSSTPPPKSKASTSSPDAIVVGHPAIDHEISSTPTQVLDDVSELSTGPSLTSGFPLTGSDHASSSLEFYSSVLVSGAPSPSRPWLSSAPAPGVATEGHSSAKPPKGREMDTLNPPSAIVATPDLPPQPPSPRPAINHGRSQLS